MIQQASKAAAAWQFFQQMLADVTKIVTEDAESERELLEGLRVIARVLSLCSQTVRRIRPRPAGVLRYVFGQPNDRRPEPGRQLLPGHDPR